MLGLRSSGRQLDDRRGPVEHLAAPVQDEVVVSGDFGEGDGEGGAVPFDRDLMIFPPRPAHLVIASVAEITAST